MRMMSLSWRNLWRNRRRTLITGSALALGTALSVGSYGLVDGMTSQMLHALTRLDLGHLQVHRRGYPRKKSLHLAIPDGASVMAKMRRRPEIKAVSPRVYAYALVSHHTKSTGAQLVGVEPGLERRVTELHHYLSSGRWLDPQPTPWPRGRSLSAQERHEDEQLTRRAEAAAIAEIDSLATLQPDARAREKIYAPTRSAGPRSGSAAPKFDQHDRDLTRELASRLSPLPARPPGVVIGNSLARLLKVVVGQQLYAMVQTVDGLAVEVKLRVLGIFHTGTEQYDRGRIVMHIRDLQRLVHLDGQIHELAAVLVDSSTADVLAAKLAGSMPRKVLVQSWGTIRPDVKNMLRLNSVGMLITIFVIFLVATLGVVNTMLMAVFDRTRELGMLKAIGMSGAKIVRLIVTETTLLAVTSAMIGTLLGLAMDAYLIRYGIDLRFFTEGVSVGGLGLDPIMRAVITVPGVVLPTTILTACCFIASFYPALRAARMPPAVGMREL